MISKNPEPNGNGHDSGGVGGSTHRAESGLLHTKEARLLGRAIRDGWYRGQRWPTEITESEMDAIEAERELTLKERVVKATFGGLDNPKAAHIHARNAISMEAQNLEEEKRGDTQEHHHTHTLRAKVADLSEDELRALQSTKRITDATESGNGNGGS